MQYLFSKAALAPLVPLKKVLSMEEVKENHEEDCFKRDGLFSRIR